MARWKLALIGGLTILLAVGVVGCSREDVDKAKEAVKESGDKLKETAKDAAKEASGKVKEAADSAKDKAGAAMDAAKEKGSETVSAAKEKAGEAMNGQCANELWSHHCGVRHMSNSSIVKQ